MIYKFLPDVRIQWSDVWIGAALTSVLFTVGKFLIGLYLSNSGVSSAYGAAGSLITVLLWVYYLFIADIFSRCGIYPGIRKPIRVGRDACRKR